MLVNKITTGFVIQQYDTETKEWVSQDFFAGDECEYEDAETGEPVEPFDDYLCFTMVQPSEAYPDADC